MNTEEEMADKKTDTNANPKVSGSGFEDIGDPIMVSAGDPAEGDEDEEEEFASYSPIEDEFKKEPCCRFARCVLGDEYPRCQLSIYMVAVLTAMFVALVIQYFGLPVGIRQLYDCYVGPSLKKVLQRPLELLSGWFDTDTEEVHEFEYQHEF